LALVLGCSIGQVNEANSLVARFHESDPNGLMTDLLRAVFFAFNQLSEISFRFGGALIFAVLVALLNNVQNPLDRTTTGGVLANFELAG
jgi:hypothetical protein